MMGVFTDIERKTQIKLTDTPGATKASNSMRSNLLVTRAWDCIEENDQVIFIVDAAKRMSFEVKSALIRLNKRAKSVNPNSARMISLMEDASYTDKELQELMMSEE